MIKDYTRTAEGVTNLMAHQLDGSRIDEYLDKNFELEDYREVRRLFQDLKMNYSDMMRIIISS